MTLETESRSFDPKNEARRFALFVALGGCAAAINWLSRFPLQQFMPFPAAVAGAYMIGMVVAFILFSRYVFPGAPLPLAHQVKFFVLVNLAGIAQVWGVSMALVYFAFPAIGFTGPLAESLAHGIAIGVPTISSYFGHKFLTFKANPG